MRHITADLRGWRSIPVLLLGWLLVLGVQSSGHVIPAPLFDGMMIVEPYRYLEAPAGATGNPTHVDRTRRRPRDGRVVSGSTRETPPQAQVFTTAGKMQFRAGATSYRVTINPVVSPTVPPVGYLVGNAYAISIVDDRGRPVRPRAGKRVTVALRAPAGVSDPVIALYDDGAWRRLRTFASGLPDVYLADVAALGTFVLISDRPDPGCYGYYLPGDLIGFDGTDATPDPTSTPAAPGASTGVGCPAVMADDPNELFAGLDQTPAPFEVPTPGSTPDRAGQPSPVIAASAPSLSITPGATFVPTPDGGAANVMPSGWGPDPMLVAATVLVIAAGVLIILRSLR